MSDINKQQQNNAPPNISMSPIITNEISTDANEMAAKANIEIVNTASGSVSSNNMNTEQLSPNIDKKKIATKRTPSKRLSFIERAQKESEELVRNMGGSLELEGGRRTRSSARGTPTKVAVANTPPPTKKSRNSPSTSRGVTTPTPRGRGRGRKLDTTTTDTDEETNTTAATSGAILHKTTPNKEKSLDDAVQDNSARRFVKAPQEEEHEGKLMEKVEEVKQRDLSDEQEREQQSQNKANEEIVPSNKDTEMPDGDSVTQKKHQQLSLKEKSDVTLNSVPEETSSQINEEMKQEEVVTVELKVEDGSARHERESSAEIDVTTKSNISSNQIERQHRQSPRPTQQQQQLRKLDSTTTLTAKSVNVIDIDESKENENVQPKSITIDENDVDDEPMDIDSSSKSNDAVEIIESDSNMGESAVDNMKIDLTKDNVAAVTSATTSGNRSTTTVHKLNETLNTSSVITVIEDNCDGSNTNANTHTRVNANAIPKIDIKAGGDYEVEKKNVSETLNCNKSSANNAECKMNSNDNEQNKRESSTSAAAATTKNDATIMAPTKI